MRKVFSFLFLIIFLFLISIFILLSTKGIKTEKFNEVISKKINQSNKNLNLEIKKINFKIDIKNLSLFLETLKPDIKYKNISIPTEYIKVYIDFMSIFQITPNIKKIEVNFVELEINQIKKLSTALKPSNLKNFIKNNFKNGQIISSIEFYLNDENELENFIARGSVTNLDLNVVDNVGFKNTNFKFFADETDILLKNITSNIENIKISDGDLKITKSPEVSIKSNFLSNIFYENELREILLENFSDFDKIKDIRSLEASLRNDLSINFDKTYKVIDFSIKSNGDINDAYIKLSSPIKNSLMKKEVSEIFLKNSKININLDSKNKSLKLLGKYSFDKNVDNLNFEINTNFLKEYLVLDTNLEFNREINIDLINYQNLKGSLAKFNVSLKKSKNDIFYKKIKFTEKDNLILIEDLQIKQNLISSLKKIKIKTKKEGRINNDFDLDFGKRILISGNHFDATNLNKFLNKPKTKNQFKKITKNIEIDLKNIKAPMSKNLKNFKLIGLINYGKFVKISSKGDFGNEKFIDISLKSDIKNKKKYFEIYSDLPGPLLTEYSFFEGLSGGKLLFSSVFDDKSSNLKLIIEDFKVINAPGVVKLLSLADLGGLADLAEGEGLSFDVLEISLNDTDGLIKFNEIYAVGPSISVLMEGQKDRSGLVNLDGTLVPAKNLNKLISKIPVLGDIIIPKEVGEGLFGISFKLKGKPGKIKSSINPIKTITPRFLQKILSRNKRVN